MNILFLGYWGANEGLTSATILPHLKILSEFDNIENIIFCSIERNGDTDFNIDIPKVRHIPLYSEPSKIPLWDKIQDFIAFPRQLIELINSYNIDKLICRGAPAGALGYLVWKKIKIPYYVESYEPHAEYMLESGVWTKYDPRYLFEKHWEQRQNKTASGLMPVSENYRTYLIDQCRVNPSKVDTIPCCVDLEKFKYKEESANWLRKELNILEESQVFVYLGKFGGLYIEDEVKIVFGEILKKEKSIILLVTPDIKMANNLIKRFNLDNSRIKIVTAEHDQVSNYLSIANYSLALYKQGASKKYLSPIKIGEYWACGLPVLIPKGIGDDSEIVEKENVGAVFHKYIEDDIKKALSTLMNSTMPTREIAEKYRSFEIVRSVYSKWYLT